MSRSRCSKACLLRRSYVGIVGLSREIWRPLCHQAVSEDLHGLQGIAAYTQKIIHPLERRGTLGSTVGNLDPIGRIISMWDWTVPYGCVSIDPPRMAGVLASRGV